ncbi:MAG: hypothetical protein ACYC96_11940 [Fimbriimonadaceae bacterium]
MAEPREFKARAVFAGAAVLGYGTCIVVSLGYMAGRHWANVWPLNLITEALLLYGSTLLVLQSYLRVRVGPDEIVMRLPKGSRAIRWENLSVYELTGKGYALCKLHSFDGTSIRIRFASFDHGQELAQLIDRYATKPV